MVIEAPDERLAQDADLGPHPGEGHLGEHLGVAFPGDERLQHPPRRDTEDVGGDRIQLDAGVLEQPQAMGSDLRARGTSEDPGYGRRHNQSFMPTSDARHGGRHAGLTCYFVERTTGFEPATLTLAR